MLCYIVLVVSMNRIFMRNVHTNHVTLMADIEQVTEGVKQEKVLLLSVKKRANIDGGLPAVGINHILQALADAMVVNAANISHHIKDRYLFSIKWQLQYLTKKCFKMVGSELLSNGQRFGL